MERYIPKGKDKPAYYIFLFTGGPGSGKTFAALSGEGLTGYHEFDPRSLSRAATGMHVDRDRVHFHEHHLPMNLRDLGTVEVGRSGGAGTTAVRHLEGYREQYEQFLDDYVEELTNSEVQQVVWDTETRAWQMHQAAWQQQIQEAQAAKNQPEIDRMDPLKFTEAKKRYLRNTDAAYTCNKHLILVSHLKEEWVNKEATGKFIHDGMKEAPGNADLQLEFRMRNKVPIARVVKPSGRFEGMEIEQPTIPILVEFLDGLQIINDMGGSLPDPLTLSAVRERAAQFRLAMA